MPLGLGLVLEHLAVSERDGVSEQLQRVAPGRMSRSAQQLVEPDEIDRHRARVESIAAIDRHDHRFERVLEAARSQDRDGVLERRVRVARQPFPADLLDLPFLGHSRSTRQCAL